MGFSAFATKLEERRRAAAEWSLHLHTENKHQTFAFYNTNIHSLCPHTHRLTSSFCACGSVYLDLAPLPDPGPDTIHLHPSWRNNSKADWEITSIWERQWMKRKETYCCPNQSTAPSEPLTSACACEPSPVTKHESWQLTYTNTLVQCVTFA